jgi:integrase
MAYIRPVKGGFRVECERQGQRKSATFETRREAVDWGRRTDLALLESKAESGHTFAQAVTKYQTEVSAKKDGGPWEVRRLNAMLAHFPGLLADIEAPQVASWRDKRLQTVSGSTVVREVNLLRNLFNVARLEWRWIEHQPFAGVKMPKENPPRHQVWAWQLIRRVLQAPRTGKTAEMQQAFHIALRTGMRLAEVLQAPEHFDAKRRVVVIKTKTEARAEIPIGRIAAKLLQRAPFVVGPNEGSVLFGKLCRELLIDGLTFHDTRATALTLLARKVDVLTLAKISRHKDIRLLSNVYYRESADQIAARI